MIETASFNDVISEMENTGNILRENWCVPRESGRFLHVLALNTQAKRICEVGTSIGYSTLWLAKAMESTGGHVDTIEYYIERQEQARANVKKAQLEQCVSFHLGQANEQLKQFQEQGKVFDLAFIDAAKREYIDYARVLEQLLTPGGLLIADNTRSHRDEMLDFLAYMEESSMFDVAEIETKNGQLLARKR